ncbi:MAG: glycosyltransferase [Candidatus Aenigmarchaeota archaeon]|nr:glycosyltransferase [Candidatus Aenigmarchaeota archaeon]
MKILYSPCHYFFTNRFGSEFLWSYKIIENLSKIDDVEITALFLTEDIGSDDYSVDSDSIKIISKDGKLNLPPPPYNFSITKMANFISWYYKKARRIMREEKIDVIHHLFPFAFDRTFNPLIFNLKEDLPFITGPLQAPQTSDPGVKNYKQIIFFNTVYFPLKFLSRKTLKKSSRVVCVSEESRKFFQKTVNHENIEVIPCGIDVGKFPYVKRENKNTIELMTASTLIKRKRIDLLIKAFDELSSEYTDLKLRILGDGPEERNLKLLTRKLNLDDKVIFEGRIPREKIFEYYKNAGIYVSLSASEALPVNLMESMSTGLPTVSSINRGSKELIRNNENGVLVGDEIKSIVDSVSMLIEDKNFRKKIGSNARKTIERRYNWDVISHNYYRLYSSLITGDL